MELQTINLSKRFAAGKLAVRQVNLTLTYGIYGLLGANGAGKTTLMRLLCNLQTPSAGEIRLDGQNIRALGADYRQLLGYLPQHFAYYPNFPAEDFLLYAAALKGLPPKLAGRRVGQLLAAVGLADERRRRIRTFSGGMRQRLGIAQALLAEPQILLLDEPTAGLDPLERVRFRQLLQALAGCCIVLLSTHIISDVELAAQKIILLRAGQVVRCGSRREVLDEVGAADLEDAYLHTYQQQPANNEGGLAK